MRRALEGWVDLATRRVPWAGALAGLALVGACARATPPVVDVPPPRQHLFILLPDDSGHVGSISVSNAAGAQVLSQPGQAVRVPGAGAAPSPPFTPNTTEVARVFGEALAAQPPAPLAFVLYFKDDSDQLTQESEAFLADVVRSIRERRASDVSIVGHTDTVGTPGYNYRLGLRRAERVRAVLHDRGLLSSAPSVESRGERDLLVPTADGVAEPRNRRVEVIVR